MNKNTINQICDKLIMLADNYAEQERILRSLESLVRSLKDEAREDKPSNKKEDQLDIIERLLREMNQKRETYPKEFPFDTHPHLNPKVGDPPGWWKNQPLCNPCSSVIYSDHNIFPNGSSFIGGGSITVVPCSNPPDQQIIYADAKGVHIKDSQNER